MNDWSLDFLSEFEERLKSHLQAAELTDLLSYQFYPAGKRIRPLFLAALAADFGDETTYGSFLDSCCALEILHTASLIHDDLPALDNDIERRGRPTLHVIKGEARALLAGDWLIAKALHISGKGLNPDVANRITELFSESFYKVCHGQIIDIENSCGTEQEVLSFYDLKTGALFYAAAEAARLIVAASDPVFDSGNIRLKVIEMAQSLGRAFQVKNDLLEICGGRTTDQDNDRKTIFTVRGAQESQQYFDALRNQTFDNVSDLETMTGRNLLKTRSVIERLL